VGQLFERGRDHPLIWLLKFGQGLGELVAGKALLWPLLLLLL